MLSVFKFPHHFTFIVLCFPCVHLHPQHRFKCLPWRQAIIHWSSQLRKVSGWLKEVKSWLIFWYIVYVGCSDDDEEDDGGGCSDDNKDDGGGYVDDFNNKDNYDGPLTVYYVVTRSTHLTTIGHVKHFLRNPCLHVVGVDWGSFGGSV